MALNCTAIKPSWKPEQMVKRANRELSVDKVLLALVLGLALFGLTMIYSASAMIAQKRYGSQFYFLIRQSVWAAIGLVAMAAVIRIDYRHYKHPVVICSVVVISLGLLVAVLFLPVVNGTHRWIRLGQASLQPSEVAKLALVAFLAFFIERRSDALDRFASTFLPLALMAGTYAVLIAAEPDLGTALLVGFVFAVVAFAAGLRLRYLAVLLLPVAPALLYMLLFVPWRLQRLLDFLDPWKNQTTSAFQVAQSLIAIGSGGLSGVGFAQGKQKLFYIPAPQNDFIFAVIGEELGLIGAAAVILVFVLIGWRGFRAARCAPDLFGQLMATGITVMIIAQALFNISVALSLVPTKGIPLPFISYGGTSLAMNLLSVGVLLNISKHAGESWH
jgi:cell division protein FtsW